MNNKELRALAENFISTQVKGEKLDLAQGCLRLLDQLEVTKTALERLASNEAFYLAGKATEEDKMRIDFARQALSRLEEGI